jgi:hypothetical protein
MRQCLTPIVNGAEVCGAGVRHCLDRDQRLGCRTGPDAMRGDARPLRKPPGLTSIMSGAGITEPGSGIASIAISVAAAGQGPTRCEEMPDPLTAPRLPRSSTKSPFFWSSPIRGDGGVWHLLIRARKSATAWMLLADEAMPDPDRDRSRGQALPRSRSASRLPDRARRESRRCQTPPAPARHATVESNAPHPAIVDGCSSSVK